MKCQDCDRHNKCNDVGLIKWLLSEHIEETYNKKICEKLKVDDKILVSNVPISYSSGCWKKRHFAGYDSESDSVLTFDSGTTSWTVSGRCISHWKYAKLPEEVGEQNE